MWKYAHGLAPKSVLHASSCFNPDVFCMSVTHIFVCITYALAALHPGEVRTEILCGLVETYVDDGNGMGLVIAVAALYARDKWTK